MSCSGVFKDKGITTLKKTFLGIFDYLKVLIIWIFVSAVVGILGGVIGSVFHLSIDFVTEYRIENGYILYFLPLGGILIAAVYGIFKSKGKIDTNRVLEAVKSDEKVPLVMAPLIFVSTVITHLLGGSAGREGAALQLGGSIGYNVGKVFRLRKDNMHIIVMSGMSAVFAALFGTPLTAAFFAIEVVSVGVWHYVALVPCVVSALVASQTALAFGLHPVKFALADFGAVSPLLSLQVVAVAALCAVVGILFCLAIHNCEHLFEKLMPNKYLKAVVGGAVIVLLTLIIGSRDYNGAGMDIVEKAIGGEVKWEAFALKIIFTAVTIAAGFKGGEIVPAFFVGSTFGCAAGMILGINPGFAAAIGFVALFCSVVNCPLASIILSIEVFGTEGILLFALACGVSYMLSGYFGLYKSQKIVYSKLNEELVDISTK